MKIKDYTKILINQTAFIGDVVLTLPLVAKIKQINPNCQIHFLTTKISSQIPKLMYEIDKVIIFDKRGEDKGLKGLFNLSKFLKKENYDLIISPHRSFRTSIMNFLISPKLSVTFNTSSLSFLYSKKVKYNFKNHEIYRNLSLLSIFDEYDNERPKIENLNYESNVISKVDNFIESNELEQFIIIAAGSVWATKRWLPKYFAELSKMIINKNYKVVIIGSKDDKTISNEIADKANNKNLIDICGEFNIPESINLIGRAKMIITNDSAPIHFAGLVGTKTVAIFGPTIPEFGFAPIGDNDVIIQNNDLKCRPCAIHGGNKCPIGTHECMVSISPQYVFRQLGI